MTKDAETLEAVHTHTHTHKEHLDENSEKPKRVQYIDIARGIAILLVIVGHMVTGLPLAIIYSFHMPLFIIASGMLYKEKSYDKAIKDVFFKLILPYIICILVVNILFFNKSMSLWEIIKNWAEEIFYSFVAYRGGKINYPIYINEIGSLWFFPFLAIIRMLFRFLKKISKGDQLQLLFSVSLISFIGYLLGINAYFLPYAFDIALFGIIFYYIGYILSQTKSLDKILSNKKLLVIIFLIWVLGIKFNNTNLAGRIYSNGVFLILTSTCGTIMIFKISQIIEKYMKHLGKILAWYGRNSMYILLLHYAESMLIRYETIPYFIGNTIWMYIIQIIAYKITICTVGTFIINGVKRGIFYIKDRIKFNLWKKELS